MCVYTYIYIYIDRYIQHLNCKWRDDPARDRWARGRKKNSKQVLLIYSHINQMKRWRERKKKGERNPGLCAQQDNIQIKMIWDRIFLTSFFTWGPRKERWVVSIPPFSYSSSSRASCKYKRHTISFSFRIPFFFSLFLTSYATTGTRAPAGFFFSFFFVEVIADW